MTAMFINIIPEFRHDQAVQRLMVASTSSDLSAVLDMLMLGISLKDISVPPAAAEYARRFAQHDLSLKHCCGPTGWANTGPAPRWPGSRPPMRRPCAPGGRDRRNRAQQLYPHAQLALAGLLIDRRDAVRVWVQRTLGQLARDDQSIARLRKTLGVLLEANGSYLKAAARMHVHKNTVLYRVRKAEELLGRPVTDGRLAIEVALLACDQLAATTKAAETTRPPRRATR